MINKQEVHSISDMKEISSRAGQHWFDDDTMRWFNSKIYTPLYKGGMLGGELVLFVSSEKGPDNVRRFTVRIFCTKTGEIVSSKEFDAITGEFQEFGTQQAAHNRIKKILHDDTKTRALENLIHEYYKQHAAHLRYCAARQIEEAEAYEKMSADYFTELESYE